MKKTWTLVAFAALMTPLYAQQAPTRMGVEPNDRFDPYDLTMFVQRDTVPESLSVEPGVMRERFAGIRTDLFAPGNAKLGDRTAPGSVVELNLFEDVYLTAVLEIADINTNGTLSWSGYLAEYDQSRVTMVVDFENNLIVGNIVAPYEYYQIRYVGNGLHTVRQVDQGSLPEDAEPLAPIDNQLQFSTKELITRADTGSVVDVMVLYTSSVRQSEGGTAAAQALVNLAVAETNQGYANSNVGFSLNLVHSYETSYNESSNFSTNLSRLAGKTDGYMDDVHAIRDQYCADVVALIIDGTQYCGIAYIMTNVSTAFESSAFSVTARVCATGYYSFGHELGHNMGARHDWYVDGNTSPYIYNHGYTYPPGNWRTIMAYNNACSGVGGCTRIDYWSNPNVTYGGVPMGVGGSTVGSSANNAMALNMSASTVANFRDSSAGSCGEEPPPPTGITLSANGYKVKGKHTIDLSWSGASSTNVDIYRDGALIATVTNNGAYTDSTNNRGGGSYDYEVCEAGTSTCSATVTVNF